MVEGFTLLANRLKRKLKIITNVPNSYYNTKKDFPAIILFDGDLFFSYLNEKYKEVDMTSILNNINSEFLVISLFPPRIPEWRVSELNPYYNGTNTDVDTSLSYLYFEYITNELIPLLKQKYRINDDIYLMGVNDASIAATYMVYNYDIYKGALLYSPDFTNTDKRLFDDLDINYKKEKRIYLYMGEKDSSIENLDSFYKLEKHINKSDYYICDFDTNSDNSFDAIKNHFENGFKIINRG